MNAAIGWLGLENWREAAMELDNITPSLAHHPDVLEVRFQIHAMAHQWEAAADVAREITRLQPNEPGSWLHLAYAVRRKLGGGLAKARAILAAAHQQFPKESTIAYNLACYECQLDNLTDARNWLRRAIELGDSNQIRDLSLRDPDLEPLHSEIRVKSI